MKKDNILWEYNDEQYQNSSVMGAKFLLLLYILWEELMSVKRFDVASQRNVKQIFFNPNETFIKNKWKGNKSSKNKSSKKLK